MTARTLTRRQARWSLFLSRFDFFIEHRPGRLGGKPDHLSRRVDHMPQGKDNMNNVLLKPEVFKANAMRRGHVNITADKSLLKRIKKTTTVDDGIAEALRTLQVKGPKKLSKGLEEWNTEDGLILWNGKVYVPKDEELRRDIVKIHHDTTAAGHPGRWKTFELLSRNYWWPGISRFVERYVSGCDTCNRSKNFPRKPVGPLQPNAVPNRPWEIVSTDFITHLPLSNGYDTICVVVDRKEKEAHFIPTVSTIDAAGTSDLWLKNVWRYHGLPKQIISDRGPQFASQFMKDMLSKLGVKASLSTAYHPQTDGQTERVNQELEQYLRMFTNYRQDNWSDYLYLAEFAYNNHAHASTRMSPFYATRGYHPELSPSPNPVSSIPQVSDRVKLLHEIQEETKSAMNLAADTMKRYYDRFVQEAPDLPIGSKVWLDARNVTTTAPTKKLADRRLGPFKIVEKISDLNYKLKLPKSMKIHPVFHVSLLYPVTPDTIPGRFKPPPPPIEVRGREEWEVEEILDSRLCRGRYEYLVKWRGFPSSENSWEPVENVENAPQIIARFHELHPGAPRQIERTAFASLKFQPYENLTEVISALHHFDWINESDINIFPHKFQPQSS
jgi:hypothetical protein